MGIRERWFVLTLALFVLATGCDISRKGSSGGNRKGNLPKQPLTEVLNIVTQWPQDQDKNVPTETKLAVQFDSALHPACIEDGLTYLEERDTGVRVDITITVVEADKSLYVKPKAALETETWYTCHLSPLLCDRTERLLEEDLYFSFRTVDTTSPKSTSLSVAHGSTGVARDVSIYVKFDEPLDPLSVTSDTVHLADDAGSRHRVTTKLTGDQLSVSVVRDLLPMTRYTLTLIGGSSGLRDLAGNPLTETVRTRFTTAVDTVAPHILRIFPNNLYASPAIHVLLMFDESVDPDSIESSALTFKDQFGNFVQYTVVPEDDYRVIRLVPLNNLWVGRSYSITVHSGPGAITDYSGNTLSNSMNVPIIISSDAVPPRLVTSIPAHQATRVSHNVRSTFDFSEALDRQRVNEDTITLSDEDGELTFVVTLNNGEKRIQLTPTSPLKAGQKYTVRFRGGHLGLRDRVGNVLPEDLVVVFYTSTDRSLPAMTISPTHGHSAVSPQSTYTAAFEEALDRKSVTPNTVIVTDRGNAVVPGAVALSGGDRIITFTPSKPYESGERYMVTLRDGPNGIRESSGNWLTQPVQTSFRIAYKADITPPEVKVSVNGTADRRKHGLSAPESGFSVTVFAEDPVNSDVDLGSFEVTITGPGSVPSAEQILARANVTKNGLEFVVPLNQKFGHGTYTVHAKVADMAGNYGQSEHLEFKVVDYDVAVMPFERTQVVWVRFDLDRDGNTRSDFLDDLVRLGLITPGDPAGTNQRMIEIMREGVLAQAHMAYARKANGGRSGSDSVAILFTATKPLGVTYSEIVFGGLDPNGTPGRGFGDRSSGVLGRAFYDAYNHRRDEKNVATSPGLGVFAGELFLFEVETHLSLYPVFVTRFAKRFLKLVPKMGGQSVGTHAVDKKVLAKDFDLGNASAIEMRRYFDIMLAADDWATATGIILAHEVGHTVGLVATGAPPSGLHGDGSLHNRFPNLGDVMSSAVGYDSLVNLKWGFRDLNIAYLRQRVLLK